MNNSLLQVKFKQRLNKLDSMDNDNIQCWQIAEAFNKAALEFVRSAVQGYNQKQENRERGLVSLDDLQILVKEVPLLLTRRKNYDESNVFNADYLYFKSVRSSAVNVECSVPRKMNIALVEETNADEYQLDELKKPSFEWQETFATVLGNRVRVYTNGEFSMKDASLVYYRKPFPISIEGCIDVETGATLPDVISEFKDDIVELIITEAVALLAGDIGDLNKSTSNSQNASRKT